MRTGEKLRFAMAVICVLALSLTGCGNAGKLDEGDCVCVVSLENIPQEFDMLGDNGGSLLKIEVVLENITTERQYHFILDEENGFKKDASLYPGVYRVHYCLGAPYFLNMDISSRQGQLDVTSDKVNELAVYIKNMDEFSNLVHDSQPIPEVMQLDKFSRKMQWERQIIDMERIADYVEFESDRDFALGMMVRSYEQVTLHGSGISITLQNQTQEEVPWTECKLIKIQTGRPNVVFPQGVRVGMSIKEIVHAQEGIYGKPDSMTGALFIGIDVDSTGIVYYDESSGDRLTLECDSTGKYISNITYEFAAYK